MSYDLEIWSVRELVQLPATTKAAWQERPGGWSCGSGAWQFVIEDSVQVEPEDITGEIASSLPGIKYLTRFHVEGASSGQLVSEALTLAKGVARSIYGLVADEQTNELILPVGIRRLNPIERSGDQERFTELSMSWWFLNDSPINSDRGLDELLSLIEKFLPELLPQRYGSHEPLEFKYTETGRKHFLNFLATGLRRSVIWKPEKPFSIEFSFPKETGAHGQGFRTNYFNVRVDSALLKQPGWQDQLRLFWEEMSVLIKPIYGDVRKLKGQPRSGWYLPIDPEREEHPIRSWFWRGVPATLGLAVVLGESYQLLWPKFTAAARTQKGSSFLSVMDWSSENELQGLLPQVPERILSPAMQPTEAGKQAFCLHESDYPVEWPFGPKFRQPTKL